MMDDLFSKAAKQFVSSGISGRNLHAFRCFWLAALMIVRDLIDIAMGAVGCMMRVASLAISMVMSGSYILIVHPIASLFSSKKDSG